MKYSAKLHQKAFGDFAFIGTVEANSIFELKEKARTHARSWNKRGRISIDEENTGRQFSVNA